jgi:SAM-dependent methyltransferase
MTSRSHYPDVEISAETSSPVRVPEAHAGFRCRVCGCADGRRIEAREMLLGLRHAFEYFECFSCSCLQIMSPPEDMGEYYPETYYSFEPPPSLSGEESFLSRVSPIERMRLIRNRSAVTGRGWVGKTLLKHRPHLPLSALRKARVPSDARILDVGTGAGRLVVELRRLGFTHVLGVDPFVPGSVMEGTGPVVLKDTILGIEGNWDLIMFHHSFEHIWDSRRTLLAAVGLLARHGKILIRTPTTDSHAWRRYGTDWVGLDAPRHFIVHSSKSMQTLADEVGLELFDKWHASDAMHFWASEQYRRGIPLTAANSWDVDPGRSPLTRRDIHRYRRQARLHGASLADETSFYLRAR